MPAKDALARGARSATYGTSGHAGDEIILKNVAPEEEPAEFFYDPQNQPKPRPRKRFRPLGKQVLVRRAESTTEAFTDMKSAMAAEKPGLVLIQEETNQEFPAEGLVISVGPEVVTVGKGEYISFGKYAGAVLPLNGENLLLMSVDEILGIIEDETEVKTLGDYEVPVVVGKA